VNMAGSNAETAARKDAGSDAEFDALVIGAGVGGVCAAARLAHRGYRTLLVEAADRVGGRASTREIDGFLVNTGALVIEIGGAVDTTLREVGKPLELYVPRPATVLRWGGRNFNADSGPIGWGRSAAPQLLKMLTDAFPWLRPRRGQSVTAWLNLITRNKAVHRLVDNVVGAMFAASGEDLPADVFLHYFADGSAFKKIGFAPGGTIEVWKPLVDVVTETGGQVWLNSTVSKLTIGRRGLVDGAIVERDGASVTVRARLVVSDVGPLATVALADADNLPAGYAQRVRRATDPSAIITVHFASRKPLANFDGLALIAKSRRLVYAANFSAPEQRRTPEGWHLYCGASVPRPARGPFDLESEKSLLLADLREQFPGFDDAKILAINVTAHDWPAQRAVSGYDLPVETPIPNLWNVGDGVKLWGQAGTAACAENARVVVERIVTRYPAPAHSGSGRPDPAPSRPSGELSSHAHAGQHDEHTLERAAACTPKHP
jgi:phytoene desaturase